MLLLWWSRRLSHEVVGVTCGFRLLILSISVLDELINDFHCLDPLFYYRYLLLLRTLTSHPLLVVWEKHSSFGFLPTCDKLLRWIGVRLLDSFKVKERSFLIWLYRCVTKRFFDTSWRKIDIVSLVLRVFRHISLSLFILLFRLRWLTFFIVWTSVTSLSPSIHHFNSSQTKTLR